MKITGEFDEEVVREGPSMRSPADAAARWTRAGWERDRKHHGQDVDQPESATQSKRSFMTSRAIRRLIIIVIIVISGFVLRFTVFKSKAVPVTAYRVAAGRVEEIVTNSKAGTVMSRRRATLSTEIGGRVAELPVHEGDRVKKGDVLVRIADADYKAQLELEQRSFDAAVAAENEARQAVEQAERDLNRNRQLFEQGIVSQGILDQIQSQWERAASARDAAHARVRQAQAAVDLAQVNRVKTELLAPFDGVVAEVRTEMGEWITPSPPGLPMPAVIELLDTKSLYVSAALDEVDVAKVYTGLPVRITMDSYPGRAFSGHVTRVAPYVLDVQQQNRTFETEVEFDDPASLSGVLPGTSADIAVILEAHEPVLRIPSYALMEGNKVMIVTDNTLASATVKTGLKNWEFAEITSGLSAGDLIAVSLDRADVTVGARVRIESETAK
jgi:HlyD family secretion protein